MSNNYDQIAQTFHQRIDCIAGAVDELAPGLEAAAECIMKAVLDDRKVLVVGCGQDAALANYVATTLRSPTNGSPPLPAVPLVSDRAPDPHDEMWIALKTLSRDGDVVLCMDSSDQAPLAHFCARFASARNLTAVLLSESMEENAGLTVALRAENAMLRRELMLMACHSLAEQIRHSMLGE
ncbi:MAG: phosphoheptose isomerase [Congregibacter sp.]